VKTVLVLLSLLAVSMVLSAQSRVEPPGARQPRSPARPRIAPMAESAWGDAQRQMVEKYGAGGWAADNGFRTLLHLPPLVDAVMPYTIYLSEESTLAPRERSILILRAAWLAGSQPLWAKLVPAARKAGLADGDVHRIAEGPDAKGWSPLEAALLRMSNQLYRNSAVNDATWKAITSSYDLFHQIDAVETFNHFVVLSMLWNSFGVQPTDGATDRLPTDVPYRVNVPAREPPLTVARVDPVPGDGIAVGRTFARHPKLNVPRGRRANFINSVSKLQPKHREMFILRIGWDCRSEYEWAQHVGSVGRAREHGLDPARIAEGPSAAGWDSFEQAILRAVDELYRDAMVSDATWTELSSRYDTSLMMSGVFTSSSYRATSMSLNAYGVQLEPGNERFPAVSER
jgi:4-carboxymuconolactone decarboxylase